MSTVESLPPDVYPRALQEAQQPAVRASARAIVPIVMDLLAPRTVVDVGCGRGTWLAVFQAHGVTEICGLDGPWIEEASLEIAPSAFGAVDLTLPLPRLKTFDLVVSLEVAEHLPPECAATFVRSLSQLGPAVVFSAAVPQQGGHRHLNEQWPEYWIDRFASLGYVAIDCIRPRIWHNADVEYWYAQNTFLFVAHDVLHKRSDLRERAAGLCASSAIHPRRYLQLSHECETLRRTVRTGELPLSTLIRALPNALARALRTRLIRPLAAKHAATLREPV